LSPERGKAGRRWPGWLPVALAIGAFASAFAFATVEQPAAERLAASVFCLALGTALLLWGLDERREGRIRGHRVHVHAGDNPRVFLLLLALKRFVPGAAMVLAGLWLALRYS